jgi:phosphoribosyl-ATP pyrophosphohydrolase
LDAATEKHCPATTTRTLDARPCHPLNGGVTETLRQLETTIAARRNADPASSYVAKLNTAGVAHIARKVGEEAVETVIAALSDDNSALTGEAADLLFHLLVLLGAKGVALADVEA